MAKKKPGRTKGGANKSELIRQYLKTHGDVRNGDVVAALAGYGVTPALVSNVRTGMKKKKRKKKGASPAAKVVASAPAEGLSLDRLLAAKRVAAQLGGVEQARAAFEALSKLKD